MNNFAVGDRVRVLECSMVSDIWCSGMDKFINFESEIITIEVSGNVKLKDGQGYIFPVVGLEKIEDEV